MEAPMAKITRKIGGGCADRSCPEVYETDDPEIMAVTVTLPGPGDNLSAAGPDATGEVTGFIPTARLRAWASGQ
jgi:hypothetical protein